MTSGHEMRRSSESWNLVRVFFLKNMGRHKRLCLFTGKITVNGREQEVYFARPSLRLVINQPFGITDRAGQYDVIATVKGGGLSGQAGAVKHGIAQALTRYEPALRGVVKQAGFLTRDSRVVERKKYGKAKARRSFQFSKR